MNSKWQDAQLGMQLYRQGKLEQAQALAQARLKADRDDAEALGLLGLIAARQGDLARAEALIRRALATESDSVILRRELAGLCLRQGRTAEAMDLCREILDRQPELAEVHNFLGNLYAGREQYAQALAHFQASQALDARFPETHFNLGQTLRALARPAEAAAAYRQAVERAPDFALGWLSLGEAELESGHQPQAEISLRQALELDAELAEAWKLLAQLYQGQQRLPEALAAYQQLARLMPEQPEVFNLMGVMQMLLGETPEALSSFGRALRLDSQHYPALINAARCYQRLRKHVTALELAQRAAALRPHSAEAWETLAQIYDQSHQPEAARQAMQKAQELAPRPGLRVRQALILPGLYTDAAQILAVRQAYEAGLDRLLASDIRLANPHTEVGYVPFYLLYQHLPMRRVAQKLARFYLQACPELGWIAPACRAPGPRPARIKIGFVSTFLVQHSIGKTFRRLIQHLSRELFEVTVFAFARPADALAQAIHASAEHAVILSPDLFLARREIAATRQHLLFYPDIGMASLTYFLAFARLAPLQCVTWGHGVTTGIPNLDAFISSHWMESAASRHDYSEELLLMENLFPDYSPPLIQTSPPKQRRDFGLPEEAHLYICPQSGFKLHPDFDATLAEILRRDPKGLVILLEGHHPAMGEFLRARLARHAPDVAGRIRFLPRQSPEDFPQLVRVCDVMLDSLPIGGGNTTYDTLLTGTPIVTFEGTRASSRLTAACFRQIGYTETVTHSREAYIALAVRLGTEPAYRAQVSAELLAHAPRLYNNTAAVRELETLLMDWVSKRWPGPAARQASHEP